MNDSAHGASTDRLIAMVGNPNVGKTTLFNALTGERRKTSNFPGTTQDARTGALKDSTGVLLMDLPGAYSLTTDQPESQVCAAVLQGDLAPIGRHAAKPDEVLVVLDAANMRQGLVLTGEVLRSHARVRVVLNMADEAALKGLRIDTDRLSARLGVPVHTTVARIGEGVGALAGVLRHEDSTADSERAGRFEPSDIGGLESWADGVYRDVTTVDPSGAADAGISERLDLAFTHPLLGVLTFAAVMTGLFWVIFRLAAYPMDWIDALFSGSGELVASVLPEGLVRDLLTDGVIAGVGATVIFLPQICLLFFLIALLEGTGYLARAAFVVDRLMRPFGLPGHAFVPLLSSHACAIPGIMATRTIPDKRDRLTAILIAPFMSCTARIPVYVLLCTILFPESPGLQALAFTGCYALGAAAGLVSSMIARRTVLPGKAAPMALELPRYRMPDLRHAIATTLDRGWIFLRKAGVLILGISVVLWWLNTFPMTSPESDAGAAQSQVEQAQTGTDAGWASEEPHRSYLAMIGHTLEPIMPAGADSQLSVGILASFAAREVFVTTMAVQVLGTEDAEDETIFGALKNATREDGSALFDTRTSWSMLVFYVLAMQCLPTLVVTARESGGWKWAGLQFGWMTALAYIGAAIAYSVAGVLS